MNLNDCTNELGCQAINSDVEILITKAPVKTANGTSGSLA
jgi:hypothetical protein